MYDSLRPGLQRFGTPVEAMRAVHEILAKEAAASASGLEPIEEEEDEETESAEQEQEDKQKSGMPETCAFH